MGFRRGAVDFVGEEEVREDRTWDELEFAAGVGGGLEDLGADDVGWHEVRGELDALELEAEDFSERRDEEGLGQPWNAGDEAVALAEDRDEHFFDNVLLAYDDLSGLLADVAQGLLDLFPLVVRGEFGRGGCGHCFEECGDFSGRLSRL